MTVNDCIKQLESLRAHCDAMFDDKFASDETWDKDVQALDMASEALTNGVEALRRGEWIKCRDRLPDANGSYIICTDRGAVCSGHYYAETRRWNNPYNGHVMCWQKFPEPPEAD